LLPEQHAVLRAIARCRTAALGGYADVCSRCGYKEFAYRSCRNRHCPKCQALAQARWVEQRMERVLPTHFFHVVFTLPSELHPLALMNREAVFNILLASAAETLMDLGRDPKRLGAELGITTVLHTWTRSLLFHPHAHCIVTGGGLSLDGERWVKARSDFLFHVKVLGALFRGKFLARLEAAHKQGTLRLDGLASSLADPKTWGRLRDRLHRTKWVAYCKPPFGGPEQVFRYLGRYTHRVGISNRRIVAVDEHKVTFRTRGEKTVTVSPHEFLRRFVLHVLPPGFVKIRHYGLLAPGNVRGKLERARIILERSGRASDSRPPSVPRDFRELLLALTGLDVRICPACKEGCMVRTALSQVVPRTSPNPPDTS
jgi:hypothetical protein